ncbi:MAG: YciI family protein [Actinomycetota bacterium]|nr:YciI family protein [Actinomycetota bacterium]
MKYMLLIYGNQAGWDAMDADAHAELMRAHEAVQADLRGAGELVETNELPPESGKIVRTSGGKPLVTDGPFVESKEILAGYYIIDCPSMDRAVDIAGRLVEAEFAPIEVRQIGTG